MPLHSDWYDIVGLSVIGPHWSMIDPDGSEPGRLILVFPGEAAREWRTGSGWAVTTRSPIETIGGSAEWTRLTKDEAVELMIQLGGTEDELER